MSEGMRLLIFTEARLGQSSSKHFYCADQSFSYQIFKRYLTTFNNVSVALRCAQIKDENLSQNLRADGDNVEVLPLPYYIGPFQYIIKRNRLIREIHKCIDANNGSAIICRVPGIIGTTAAKYLLRRKRPYGVEVVGDPQDVFAPGAFNHPLRFVFRHTSVGNLKFVINGAAASIYVTKKALQARYPHESNTFSTNASDVMLPPTAFVQHSRALHKKPPYCITTVGTLDALYKSPDIMVKAIKILKTKMPGVLCKWIGSGKYLSGMVKLTVNEGVSDLMTFIGNVGPASVVRCYLDKSDLFVLPSRTEGLPRALLEAMARGLPCIGTEVGGIPELLDKDALVPVNNPFMLADKIIAFLTIPGLADAQAKRNLIESRKYSSSILDSRRIEFYEHLKDVTKIASTAAN